MNHKLKGIALTCLLLLTLILAAGCAEEKTPYEINDADQYTVSVKYDANGGIFTTNTSVIVDSYRLSDLNTDGSNQARIALLSPDNASRGNDAFSAVNNGYFLAGWYTQRTEITDESGNAAYLYSGKWDFETDLLTVDAGKTYSSAEPVLTLYAAWVPLFRIEFYDLSTGEYLDSYTFNPTTESDILVPRWNTETGSIDMYRFPQKMGYTYQGAYLDAAGTQPLEGDRITHPGTVDYVNGVAKNPVMKLYIDWAEGNWYHIYTAEQFLDNASVSGCYVIHEDLDFAGKIWPASLMYGNFSGTILGGGYTFRNIELAQTNNSKVNAGLFGNLTEKSEIRELTLENVTFTIRSGTRVAGASFGLLAGTVSSGATLTDLRIADSRLLIDSGCYFGVTDYSVGLICGMGGVPGLEPDGITCAAVGDNPKTVHIDVDGNTVTLSFVLE